MSPDGLRMVFATTGEDGKSQLWIRRLDATAAQALAGTEGGRFPFWSPDSRWLAFFADGKLKKIDAEGGPPITLANASSPRGGSWSKAGMIVFVPSSALGAVLQKIPSTGGVASPATAVDVTAGTAHRFPWFLPDGEHFLFEAKKSPRSSTGEPVPVAESVERFLNPDPVGVFSVSATGLLAYQTGAGPSGLQLTWFDREGKTVGAIGAPRQLFYLELSPNRQSMAAAVVDSTGNMDLWTYEVTRALPAHFTFDPAPEVYTVWSPDGRTIAFNSARKGHYDLYRKSANGSGAEELLYADDREKNPTSWSRDGKYLLYDTLAIRREPSYSCCH